MAVALTQFLQQLWLELHRIVLLNPLVLLLLLVLSLVLVFKLGKGSRQNLPPSPPRLPLIGNLHQLGTLPHRSLRALSNKYGPVMLLKLGHAQTLVISSAEIAKEMVKNHDVTFSNRPKTLAADIFLYGCTDVGFVPYGEYWRQTRKVSVHELLSLRRVQSFQPVREDEVGLLISKVREASLANSHVNLSEALLVIANNIVSRCVLGQKCEEVDGKSKFGEVSRRLMVQFTEFSFGDVFPYLGWVDVLTGLISRLKATFLELDALLDQVIEDHRLTLMGDEDQEHNDKDFVHILLQLQKDNKIGVELTQDNLKAILMDMFVGGTDTTATTMQWAMTELIKNPPVMKKAQEEVREIVGKKTKASIDDVKQMEYLKCVIKETLRLHPPAPLLVPRLTSESIKLGGYDVPPNVRVFVNAWAIQRDPETWDRPEEFVPERFVNNQVDFIGQDFQFIPFGSGRRSCPGIAFGVTSVEFVIANLLLGFDWHLFGQELDMSEAYGVNVTKKVPLQLVPVLYTP